MNPTSVTDAMTLEEANRVADGMSQYQDLKGAFVRVDFDDGQSVFKSSGNERTIKLASQAQANVEQARLELEGRRVIPLKTVARQISG